MNNNDTSKLVFITGLGHSGSTLFDLLLGAQERITGLGEIDVYINPQKREWFIERFDKYPCTCGKLPSECDVWGNIKSHLETQQSSYGEVYGKIFHTTIQQTDSNIVVDSSKNLNALKSVYNSLDEIRVSQDNFYVIHLSKDVRSFTASEMRNGRNSSIIKTFRHWKKVNREIEKYLNEKQIKTLRVGYDELALSTTYVMDRVLTFISNGETKEVSVDLKKTGSHIISGNNMRLDQAQKIWYDYRWFNESKINAFYSFGRSLKKLNKHFVYSNVSDILEKKTRFKAPKVK